MIEVSVVHGAPCRHNIDVVEYFIGSLKTTQRGRFVITIDKMVRQLSLEQEADGYHHHE